MADIEQLQITDTAPKPTVVGPPAGELARLLEGRNRPIVIRVKKKGKKKRKHSRGLKDIQRTLRRSTKASDRLASAFSAGFGTFRSRSNKSSRRKKDGLLKDVYKNSAAGMSKSLRKSSSVPKILAKSVKGKTVRRRVRKLSRLMGWR